MILRRRRQRHAHPEDADAATLGGVGPSHQTKGLILGLLVSCEKKKLENDGKPGLVNIEF